MKRIFFSLIMRLLMAVILIVLGGFWRFTDEIPKRAPAALAPVDGVVVLTGGPGRLEIGFGLLADGLAKRMLISGIGRETGRKELVALYPEQEDLFSCCIDLGPAEDTLENAIETALWVNEKDYRSVRIVTAGYHLPRALLEMHRRMPRVQVETYPVLTGRVRLDDWWRWPGTAALLAEEYLKYVAALVRARTAP